MVALYKDTERTLTQIILPEYPQEMQVLLGLSNNCCDVHGPGKSISDVDAKEFEQLYSLHTLSIDEKRLVICAVFPEIYSEFFCFCGIQCQVVFGTSFWQSLHLLPTGGLISA